jgi:hypothetical protein
VNLPAKFVISIDPDTRLTDEDRKRREWCATLIGRMAWLSGYIADAKYVFRGHADITWTLQSSLLRNTEAATLRDLKSREEALLGNIARDFWFKREFGFNPAASATGSNYEKTLAALQHHGVPSRLLDVTADPLVALYFAVVGNCKLDDLDRTDGAVIMIRFVEEKHGLPIHVIPAPQISPRVTAQRSRFIAPAGNAKSSTPGNGQVAFDFFSIDVANRSLGDFDGIVRNSMRGEWRGRPAEKPPNVLMFKIPWAMKPACRAVLRGLGISALSLFPGADGFRRDLAGY